MLLPLRQEERAGANRGSHWSVAGGATQGIADYRAAHQAAGWAPATGTVALFLTVSVGAPMERAQQEYVGPVPWYDRPGAKYLAPRWAR